MKLTHRKLKNGMQAILVPQKGAASMTLLVYVRVGSRYEARTVNGASHFIEHLMFKGTERRRDTLAITKELDRYGAEYNAFTGKDLTAYYIKMDAAKTELAVDLLHDMLFHSRYEKKEIDRERGVIVEEINMYEDNPRMHIEDLLEETLFPESSLGWNIAGSRENVRAMSRDALTAYRDAYYVPSRMTVVVAGKIQPGIWPLLEKTFGSVKAPKQKQDHPFVPFVAPAKLTKPVAFQQKKTEQVQLGLAFYGLPYGDKRQPAVALLATILGGSMSSRLFIQVRERRGLCYNIGASHQSVEDTGVFSIMAGLEKNRLDEAVKVIWQELKRMKTTKVLHEELRRAKDHIRGKLMLAFEDSATQADWFGKQWTFQGTLLSPEERMKRIERVTAKDIQDIAKQIFRQEAMAASVIGPFEDPKHVEKIFKLT